MEAARRAGARQAIAATASSSAVTPPRISGIARALGHPLRRELVEDDAEHHAGDHARGDVPRRPRQHHADDVARPGAERHADPELVGPDRHAVRDHAVETDRRQRQRQHREDPEQPRHQPLLRVLGQVGDPAVEIAHAHHLLLAIDADQLGAHVAQDRQRRHPRAHQDLREHPHLQRVGHVERRPDRIAQAVVARVGDDADDLQPPVAAGGHRRIRRLVLHVREPELPSDDVAVRPVLPGHRLVDHGQRARRASISSPLQRRPCETGICSSGKYSELT